MSSCDILPPEGSVYSSERLEPSTGSASAFPTAISGLSELSFELSELSEPSFSLSDSSSSRPTECRSCSISSSDILLFSSSIAGA